MNSILSITITNLVSFERYLLLAEETGFSSLLIVDALEGMFDGGEIVGGLVCVFSDVFLRDFFDRSGDNNDLFSNEYSVS